MITVIVYFKLPDGITREKIISKFEQTVQRWRDNQDLIRKNYLIDLDKGIAGGVYLWGKKIPLKKFINQNTYHLVLRTNISTF